MTKIVKYLFVIACIQASAVQADMQRSISLDTRYFGTETNNHGFAELGKEIVGIHNLAFNTFSEKYATTKTLRGVTLFSDYIISSALGKAFSVVYHEYGHYGRLESIGLKPTYENRPSNFFSFLIEKYGNPYSGEATMWDYSKKRFTPKNNDKYFTGGVLSDDWQILVSGAGLNNEMRFSGDVSDKIIEGQGETTDFFYYLIGKTSTLNYSKDTTSLGNDINAMVNAYARKGYNISSGDMDKSNTYSILFSASTYAYLLSLYDYVQTGSTDVKVPEFYGVQLPDVESYYTIKGISYKVKSGYRLNDEWRFPVSIEFIGKGGNQTDVKIGLVKVFPEYDDLKLRADLAVTKKYGLSLKAIYPIAQHFDISAGYDHENVDSLEGQRNIVSVKNGKTYNQVWSRLSYKF